VTGTFVALIELAVGLLTTALAIPLWRAGGRWPRAVAVVLTLAGAAAVLSAVSTLAGG
jgi:hypothetical protein